MVCLAANFTGFILGRFESGTGWARGTCTDLVPPQMSMRYKFNIGRPGIAGSHGCIMMSVVLAICLLGLPTRHVVMTEGLTRGSIPTSQKTKNDLALPGYGSLMEWAVLNPCPCLEGNALPAGLMSRAIWGGNAHA